MRLLVAESLNALFSVIKYLPDAHTQMHAHVNRDEIGRNLYWLPHDKLNL